MRQTIRALGWIIAILWILALLLPVSVAFSFMRLLEGRNISIREPTISFSNGNVVFSMPFYINNSGFYDLSDISVNLQIEVENRTISAASAQLQTVPVGSKVDSTLNLSLKLDQLASNGAELLTKDMDLNLNTSFHLRAAYAIAFKASTKIKTNWGAPFYNLTIHEVAYDSTTDTFSFCLIFENHVPHQLKGPLMVSLYNSTGGLLGSVLQNLNVSFQQSFQARFSLKVVNPEAMTREGFICVYFETAKILVKEWKVS